MAGAGGGNRTPTPSGSALTFSPPVGGRPGEAGRGALTEAVSGQAIWAERFDTDRRGDRAGDHARLEGAPLHPFGVPLPVRGGER
jgi:hypothetical protein